jgi:hypothetical protein
MRTVPDLITVLLRAQSVRFDVGVTLSVVVAGTSVVMSEDADTDSSGPLVAERSCSSTPEKKLEKLSPSERSGVTFISSTRVRRSEDVLLGSVVNHTPTTISVTTSETKNAKRRRADSGFCCSL